jgi:hypothetical protein
VHARRSVELYRRAGRLDGLASALNSEEALGVLEEIGHADAESIRNRLKN